MAFDVKRSRTIVHCKRHNETIQQHGFQAQILLGTWDPPYNCLTTAHIKIMDLAQIYSAVNQFIISHQLISLGIFCIMALYLWKKPWESLKILGFALALAAGFYFIMQLSQSANFGATKKHEITTEREDKLLLK